MLVKTEELMMSFIHYIHSFTHTLMHTPTQMWFVVKRLTMNVTFQHIVESLVDLLYVCFYSCTDKGGGEEVKPEE